ncbi:unnamed protein product, partial [Symbiodinium pilosum]
APRGFRHIAGYLCIFLAVCAWRLRKSGSFAVLSQKQAPRRHPRWAERKMHSMTMEVLMEMDEELAAEEASMIKRKTADFAEGERVEGVVVRDCGDSIHVDIGAAADAILERGDFIGAADRRVYLPGTHLNVTVWSKANHTLSLRMHRFNSCRCQTCFQPKEGPVHRQSCVQCWNVGRGVPPLFEANGKRLHCVVGPVPESVHEKVQALIKQGNTYWDTWAEKSSRPLQKGRLHGVGIQLSRNRTFPGTAQLRGRCNEVLGEMLDTEMVEVLNNATNEDVWQSFRWYKPPALPSREPGVASIDPADGGSVQSYIGQGYMAVLSNCSEDHAPPVPVAKLLGVPSCKETCPTCRSKGCQACEECCVHVDQDHSASLLLGIQEEDPIIDQMAFFVMGNKAFPLAGGRAFLFDGKVVPHGVWCMRGHYQGMAFVKKVPYKRRARKKPEVSRK